MKDLFCYSFLDGHLMGSEAPDNLGDAHDIAKKFCRQHSIKHMITLTPEYEDFDIEGVTRHHVPVRDLPSSQDMERLFRIIDHAVFGNKSVWIHCKQGIDRTGCVIGAYLVRRGYDSEQVIKELISNFKQRTNASRFHVYWQDKINFIRSWDKNKEGNKNA